MDLTSTTPSSTTCAVCNVVEAKYTCPRCSLKSCSLPCSTAHKQRTGCTGIRNKVEYVPMNAYSYGTLMNDYTFLEEVGRKTEEWGKKITQDGLARGSAPMRGAGRSRGRGQRGFVGHKMDKRGYLAMQLSFRDVDMDVLPFGMERTKRNQSYWDSKGKTAQLTIDFILRPTANPLMPQDVKPDPVELRTHKNDWNKTLRTLLHTHIKGASKIRKNHALFERVEALVGSGPEDASITEPLVVMLCPRSQEQKDPHHSRSLYYKLDWNDKLLSILRNKSFVEFPTIEVIEPTCFDGVLLDDDGNASMMEPSRKRRKLNFGEGKRAIAGLIGAYGSEDEELEEDDNVLDGLGDYEDEQSIADEELELEDQQRAETDAWTSEGPLAESIHLDHAREDDDDPEMNWGDFDRELAEDEAQLANLDASIRNKTSSSSS